SKFYERRSLGNSGVFIKDQPAGLYVDQVSRFRSRLLVGASAGRTGFQINTNIAFCGDNFLFGIVRKIRAVNLVRAVLVAAINNNAYVMQRSLAAFFVLLHAGSVERKESFAIL